MKNIFFSIICFAFNATAADFIVDFLPGKREPVGNLLNNVEIQEGSKDALIFSKMIGLQAMDEGRRKTRGVSDAALYKKFSPSVVLVATDDGLGSGAVISSDGRIITNWHVVGANKSVGVIFKPVQEGRAVSRDDVRMARVMRVDEVSDLALIKVDSIPPNVTPLRLGSESDIGVGLDVHAIGHPRGQAWSYTKGVISQFRSDYSWNTSEKITHRASVIQTQTPINPGNSGGPLLLSNGLMIGINSFKSSDSESLNFAVSVEEVKNLLSSSKDRVLVKTSKSKCEPKTIFEGRNEKNTAELVQVDTNCSGKMNIAFALPDDKSKPLIMFLHTKSEKIPEGMVLSYKRDFKFWELSFWDENLTETWPVVGLHKNGDAVPYKFITREEYERSLSR